MNNLSLFIGSGIGDCAAKDAGITTIAQCENDPCCLYCLKEMWPDAYQFKDVHDVSAKSLRERGLWPIDIISGGFPCQDISTAGRGEGIEGGRSGLWREMFRIIRQVRPRWLLIENVPVIRVRGVDRVIAPLERIGYTCRPLVVGAWAVGAPHKRDRVWIVANSTNRIDSASGDGELADTECHGLQGPKPTTGTETCLRRRPSKSHYERLADTTSTRHKTLSIEQSEPNQQRWTTPFIPLRWPSQPREPQYDWEAPRITQRGVGCPVDGIPSRVHARANKSLLRILGNAWCYPIPRLIYEWIVHMDAAPTTDAAKEGRIGP